MTKTITRILIGTDMSPRSDRAVERGFQLAHAMSLPVEALLILDDALPADLLAPMQQKATEQLKAICARCGQGTQYVVNVQVGDPTQELLRAAQAQDATLLVMGPHRPRPFLDGVRETTMQRVVRRTSAPVLVATIPVTGAYQTQLSLVDYGPTSTAALKLGADLAPQAKITAAHAIHVPYAGMLETTGSVQLDLQAAFQRDAETNDREWRAQSDLPANLTAPTLIRQAQPQPLVEDLCRGKGFDLITAGAHGRVGAARSYLGSLALDLMRAPPCDVLIARA